jgi:hypothetical protein
MTRKKWLFADFLPRGRNFTDGGCNLRYCRELATQVAHVAKLVNIELSLQPLGDRRVDGHLPSPILSPRPMAVHLNQCKGCI